MPATIKYASMSFRLKTSSGFMQEDNKKVGKLMEVGDNAGDNLLNATEPLVGRMLYFGCPKDIPTMPDQLRILIYDDNEPFRQALALIIGGTVGFMVLGHYPNSQQAVQQVAEHHPDVILMDIDMPGESGIETLSKLRQAGVSVPVLMLTVFDDDERVFTALRTGASGYLLKHTPPVRLLESIREVHEGGAPMTPAIARRTIQWLAQPPVFSDHNQQVLTNREQDILEKLASGLSNREIAGSCEISVETVRTHLKRIYEKLHVHSATEAVAYYYRNR